MRCQASREVDGRWEYVCDAPGTHRVVSPDGVSRSVVCEPHGQVTVGQLQEHVGQGWRLERAS